MKPTHLLAVKRLALVLFALPVLSMAKPWKSAEIITKENFKYGAFEARIRGAEGSGMITAFFLYKNGSEWAGAEWQEQDFELFGKNGGFQTQVMTPGTPRVEHVTNHVGQTPVWDRYYTYRMEWTPNALSFYVDGQLVRTETDPVTYAKILDPARAEPMNMRISLWAGDIPWSGAFDSTKVPAAVDVNWAQVYSYTPGTGPGGSDFSPLWKDDFDRIDYSRWYTANWTFEYAVNDYAPGGARASDGYLQLKMTHWSEEGTRFTPSPLDDGLLKPPGTVIDPPQGEIPVYEFPARQYVLPDTIPAILPTRFADLTVQNEGGSDCGTDALDLYATEEGGCTVGGVASGEWVEYSVSTIESANWNLSLRVAAGLPGSRFRVLVDGAALGGTITLPLGAWESFQNLSLGELPLSAGEHRIRVEFLSGGMNLKDIAVSPAGTSPLPEHTLVSGPVHLPGTVLAKNFARAMDLSAANLGGGCRVGDVDLQTTSDVFQDCNLGWTEATEWVEYDVHTLEAGDYDLTLRLASGEIGRLLDVSVNGQQVGSSVLSPSQGWAEFGSAPVGRITLPAGTSTVRLTFLNGDINFHWMQFAKIAPEAVAPGVVLGVQAVAGEGRVSLSWDASQGAVAYDIRRSDNDGASYSIVKTGTMLSWMDTDVVPGTEYLYVVVAKGAQVDAEPSVVVRAEPLPILLVTAPQLVQAVAGDRQVALSWGSVANATGYIVSRGVGGEALARIATPSTNQFTDANLANGSSYTYQIQAVRGEQVSAPSELVVATPRGLPPAEVTSVTGTAGDKVVTLSWTASARATTYTVERAVGTAAFETYTTVSTTSFRDVSVVNGTEYRYRVIARNPDGLATPSPTVTVKPVAPPPTAPSVRLEYSAGTTGATNGIRPLFKLVNTGKSALDLSKVRIRYWFTRDGASSVNYWCDWAQVGTANIQGTFQRMTTAKATADTYLEIAFKAGAGSLAAGASTGDIQSRFSKSDWSTFTQSNDASYDGTATSYRATTRSTVYLDGVLISGTEP